MRDYVRATVIAGITHPLQFIRRAGIMVALVIRAIISIQSPTRANDHHDGKLQKTDKNRRKKLDFWVHNSQAQRFLKGLIEVKCLSLMKEEDNN